MHSLVKQTRKSLLSTNNSKVTPELTKNMNYWIGNHPQVVNKPISNDTLLVHYLERPGKKIMVSKLILQI